MKLKIVLIWLVLIIITAWVSLAHAQEDPFTNREKEYLVNLARQTLYWYLKDGTIPEPSEDCLTKNLLQKASCFVTLQKRESGLRGCMGLFERDRPLWHNIIDRTIAAATGDPRFNKVTYDELESIKLEISVLTEPEQLRFNSPEDLLTKLQPNKDGVIIITKYGSSTYLPQVWEQIPDKEDFLSHLCAKHNAPPNIWRTDYKNIEVWTYQAIVFGEEIYGRRIIGRKGAVVGEGGAFVLGAVKPLPEDLYYGGYKVSPGTQLAPGAIVTAESDIIEK